MATAKIFWSGNSQAVRLPKGFRFPPGTKELEIRREGETVFLLPVAGAGWPEEFWHAFDGMPEGFERPARHRPSAR